MTFTGTKSAPTLIAFGDSITEGSGTSADANAYSYRIIAALATAGNGYVSPVSGTISTDVIARANVLLCFFI